MAEIPHLHLKPTLEPWLHKANAVHNLYRIYSTPALQLEGRGRKRGAPEGASKITLQLSVVWLGGRSYPELENSHDVTRPAFRINHSFIS